MPAIPIAATVAASVISAKAQSKAAKTQANAIKNVKGVDIADVQRQAREADLQRIADTNAAEDPTMAALRKSTDQQLLNNVLGDPNSEAANRIFSQLVNENINLDPNDANFQAKLKSEADRLLSAGGSITPEQQAELVRAGLETSSQGGYGAGSGAGRQTIGKLLISEQERLAADRAGRASELFGFATNLNSTRMSNLGALAGQGSDLATQNQARLMSLAGLTDARKENVGLTGGDVAQLALGNTNTANAQTLALGQNAAQRAVDKGSAVASIVGALGSSYGGASGWGQMAGKGLASLQGLLQGTKGVPGTDRRYSPI